MTIVPIAQVPAATIETLLDRAFGADRHLRTAYRLRAGVSAIPELSFAAIEGAILIGSIQSWPVEFVGDEGRRVPLVMIGPVAIDPARQRSGIGRMLTSHMLAAAAACGERALMLVGDPEYYGRFFDFSAAKTLGWRLPGPVEPHRLLALGDGVPSGPGAIGPRSD